MHRILGLAAVLLFTVSSAWSQAKPASPSDLNGGRDPERGWFFFEDPPKPPVKPVEEPRAQLPSELPPPPKDEKCKKKESWSPECGFVNPEMDFEFQAKQRDALMQRMSLAKNDPKAVEAFQYYMRWVLERTAETTNLWWYNMVQNPDLDPNVTSPVSTFGLRLMTEVAQGKDKEVFDLVKSEGGFFVYFSRTDCAFCHQMSDVLRMLQVKTGLEVRNASLDDKCMPNFATGCMVAPATNAPAQMLQVTTVPAVFLYIKPNTWLRVSTGIVDLDSITTRTVQFFSAYRSALLNGVENGQGGRPSVDFSENQATGTGKGVEGAKTGAAVRLPSQDDVARMLGASKTR